MFRLQCHRTADAPTRGLLTRLVVLALLLALVSPANSQDRLFPGQRLPAQQALEPQVAPRGGVENAIFFAPENDQPIASKQIPLNRRPASSEDSATAGSAIKGPSLTSLLLALGFVVVVILGIGRIATKRGPFAVPGVPKEAVEILGRRTVDPRHSILVVKVGTRVLLLSVSANGLQTLSDISDPIEVATLISYCRGAEQVASQTSIADTIKGWFGRAREVDRRPFGERFGERLLEETQPGQTGVVNSVTIQPRRENQHV